MQKNLVAPVPSQQRECRWCGPKHHLAAIRYGLELPEQDLPTLPRKPRRERDPKAAERLVALKGWRQEKAKDLKLDPGVLINNAALEEIARARPKSLDALGKVEGLKRWQVKAFGGELLV